MLWEVLLPISYYLGDYKNDERFSWRMFSYLGQLQRQCAITVHEHHYFLSLVLIACVFFPRLSARDLYKPDAAGGDLETTLSVSRADALKVSAWGYVLLGVNVAIVYFFTAIAKATDERFFGGRDNSSSE
jgi:hypothetical protein